jgi:D-lactate dehydrogenase (cytochrome)
MPLMFSRDELSAMRDIKEIFDPKGLLNPGKIFPETVSGGQGSADNRQPLAVSAQGFQLSDVRQSLRNLKSETYSPPSLQEAVEVMHACFNSNSPYSIRFRGGGTKSRLLPVADANLSTQNLRGIYAYAPDDLYVTAGAGTRLIELQEQLARDKMWVPLASPWPEATLGGIVASNFNGPLRMRNAFGSIRDQLLAATVVLPDGRVIRAGRPLVKNVAGYDLVKLFVGSFGTLGLITDVTFKITALPRARTTVIVPVEDPQQGLIWGAHLLRISQIASALLLCGGCDMPGISASHALVYTAEGLLEDVRAEIREVYQVLQAQGAVATTLSDSPPSGSEIWCRWLREAAPSETVLRLGVTLRDMPVLLQYSTLFIADLASGLLYVRGGPRAMEELGIMARSSGGYAVTLSAPTAPEDRSALWDYRPDALDLMRSLQTRWDAQGLCNPGAFLIA